MSFESWKTRRCLSLYLKTLPQHDIQISRCPSHESHHDLSFAIVYMHVVQDDKFSSCPGHSLIQVNWFLEIQVQIITLFEISTESYCMPIVSNYKMLKVFFPEDSSFSVFALSFWRVDMWRWLIMNLKVVLLSTDLTILCYGPIMDASMNHESEDRVSAANRLAAAVVEMLSVSYTHKEIDNQCQKDHIGPGCGTSIS